MFFKIPIELINILAISQRHSSKKNSPQNIIVIWANGGMYRPLPASANTYWSRPII